jgi:hypothetical protein
MPTREVAFLIRVRRAMNKYSDKNRKIGEQ